MNIGKKKDTVVAKKFHKSEDLPDGHQIRYRTLAESGRALIWTSGIDKKCDYFNKPWLDFTGRSLEQELGDGWSESVHPDDLDQLLQRYSEAFDSRESFSLNYRLRRYDNVYRWIQDDGKPLYNNHGEFIGYIGYCLDITELKLKEVTLRESEELYSIFINSTEDLVFLKDEHLRYVIVNKANAEFFNKPEADIIGKTDFELMSKEAAQNCQSTDKLALSSDKVIIHEEEIGDKVYESRKFKILFKNGSYGVGGFVRNTTKDKTAQKALEDSERLFNSLATIAPVGIFYTTKDGDTTYVNPKWCQLSGMSEENSFGTGWLMAVHPDDRERVVDGWKSAVPEQIVSNSEYRFLRPDGSIVNVIGQAVPKYNSDNKMEGFVGTITDISDRKRAEEMLRESEERFRSLVENIDFGVTMIDEDFKIIMTNVVVGQWLNKPACKFIGKKCFEEFENRQAICQHCPGVKAMATGQPHKAESESVREDGTSFPILIHAFPLSNPDGTAKKFIEVIENITERKKNENELLRAKEKAEEGDRLKTAFLHNISHEIRTPMNAIIGFSALLGEPNIAPEEQISFIDTIQKSSNHLLSIITDIINISNIEANILKRNESETNINSNLRSLYNQFLPISTDKNLSLSYEAALDNNDSVILTDRTKVAEILSNLINNALKFTDHGYIKFGYTVEASFIKFYVLDSGIGIASDQHAKIFDRFYQVESNVSRLFEGTGLGLAICKSYVELLGGTIWLTSEKDNGSEFYFTIPYRPVKPKENIETEMSTISLSTHNRTILVAEDDGMNYNLIKKMLFGYELNILHAYDGSEAIEMCRQHPGIDLVLMDIKMPVMDGYEATRQIKKFRPDLPIIAQTAYALEGDIEKTIAAGCNDYISKPLNKAILIGCLNKFLKD